MTTGTPKVVGTLVPQKDLFGCGYDPTYSNDYVSNKGSNSVTVF
ncbi:MAG: hypothetical protein WB789_09260 [Thermoplasmata archaeon]